MTEDTQMSSAHNYWYRTVIIHADSDITRAEQSIRSFLRKRGFPDNSNQYSLKWAKFNFLIRGENGVSLPIPIHTISIIALDEKVTQCLLNLKTINGTGAQLPVLQPNFKYGISILKTSDPSVNTYKKYATQIKWFKPDFSLWLPKVNEQNQTLCVRIHFNIDKMLSDNKSLTSLIGTWGTRILTLSFPGLYDEQFPSAKIGINSLFIYRIVTIFVKSWKNFSLRIEIYCFIKPCFYEYDHINPITVKIFDFFITLLIIIIFSALLHREILLKNIPGNPVNKRFKKISAGDRALILKFAKNHQSFKPRQPHLNNKSSKKPILHTIYEIYCFLKPYFFKPDPINQLIGNTAAHIKYGNHKFIHWNISGMNSEYKKLELETFIEDQYPNIISISESWILNNQHIKFIFDKNSKAHQYYTILSDHDNTCYSTYGIGTLIIIHKQWIPYIQQKISLPGHGLAIKLKFKNSKLLYITLYNSNHSNQDYKSKKLAIIKFLNKILANIEINTRIIIQGDFNEIINKDLDYNGSSNSNNTIPHPVTKLLLEKYGLIDIHRCLNPSLREFSHRVSTGNNNFAESRIDLTFISSNLLQLIESSNINTNIGEHHHNPIIMETAPFFSKISSQFNPQKTINIRYDYTNLSKQQITDYNNDLNYFPSYPEVSDNLKKAAKKNFSLIKQAPYINSQRYRYTRKLKKTITFLSFTKKLNQLSTSGISKIKRLWFNLYKTPLPDNSNYDTIISTIKKKFNSKLKRKRRQRLKKKMKARESQFHITQKKHINNIFGRNNASLDPFYIRKNDTVYTKKDQVLNEVKDFYQKLYSNMYQTTIISPSPIHNVDTSIWQNINDQFTITELKSVIKTLKTQKATGPSDITNEMIKFINNQNTESIILKLVNELLTLDEFPSELNAAKIILIPKKEDWNGELSNIRPITLINTIKKLFSALITKRLTDIIDTQDLLKGANFGFRQNHSTKNPLLILRTIIDDAKLTKKPLYSATLDVQKAYDTVPFESIILSLKRLHIPDNFIHQIHKIIQRNVVIETPLGSTETIHAERGLPQGDPISPILWNIFYDPLLIELQSKSGYKLNTDTLIQVLAYADDIHPISESPSELQEMITSIDKFLSNNNMCLNAKKSKIISNQRNEHLQFTINNQHVGIAAPDELIRILGVYWTMDGNYKKTLSKVFDDFKKQIACISYKYCPGKIMAHLINSVIIPQVAYKLQSIPISQSFINKIDVQLRKITKKKYNLPQNTKSTILLDKRSGIGINSIGEVLDRQLFSDLLTFKQQDSLTRKVLDHSFEYIARKEKTLIPLLYKPQLFTKLYSKSFSKYIIERMYHLKLSFATGNETSFDKIYKSIPEQEYLQSKNLLLKLQLTQEKITKTSDPRYILSFNQFYLNHKALFKKQIIDTIPSWWYLIVKEFGNIDLLTNATDPFTVEIPFKDTIIPDPIQPLDTTLENIDIWTDGSLTKDLSIFQQHKMGAAATFWHNDQQIDSFQIKIDHYNASSTKAELIAILNALLKCQPHQKIKIYTDSQASIDSITNFIQLNSDRKRLKFTNFDILYDINYIYKQFQQKPILIKVKSHTGLEKNDQVDILAKLASNSNMDVFKPPNFDNKQYLFLNSVLINSYPNNYIKNITQNIHRTITNSYLSERQQLTFKFDQSLKLLHLGMDKLHNLDASNVKEEIFRIQLLTKQLPVLSKVIKWNTPLLKYTDTDLCPRCNREVETFSHIFTCIENHNYKSKLYNHTQMTIQSRLTKMQLYKPLTEQLYQPKIKHIMYTLGIKGDLMNFLNTPLARGIITEDIITKFKSFKSMTTQSHLWLHLAMDSWLSAFYSIIWKRRNKLIFNLNKNFPIRVSPIIPLRPKIRLIHRTRDIPINIPNCNMKSIKFKINLSPPQSLKRKRTDTTFNKLSRQRSTNNKQSSSSYTNLKHPISIKLNLQPISIKLKLPQKHPISLKLKLPQKRCYPQSTTSIKKIKLTLKTRDHIESTVDDQFITQENPREEVNPDVGEDPRVGEDGPLRIGCLAGGLQSSLDQVNRLDGSYD